MAPPRRNRGRGGTCRWATRKTAQNGQKQRAEMERRGIRDRIDNWAAWSGQRGGRSDTSMTGIVCATMRRAALGDVWSGHGGGRQIDDVDAQRVERAWKHLLPKHRDMLRWVYIQNANPNFICRRMGIVARPTSIFDIELHRAEEALGRALAELAARGDREPGCAPRF